MHLDFGASCWFCVRLQQPIRVAHVVRSQPCARECAIDSTPLCPFRHKFVYACAVDTCFVGFALSAEIFCFLLSFVLFFFLVDLWLTPHLWYGWSGGTVYPAACTGCSAFDSRSPARYRAWLKSEKNLSEKKKKYCSRWPVSLYLFQLSLFSSSHLLSFSKQNDHTTCIIDLHAKQSVAFPKAEKTQIVLHYKVSVRPPGFLGSFSRDCFL